MLNKKLSGIAMLIFGAAALAVYCFFCPNDKTEGVKIAEILLITLVTSVFLLLFEPEGIVRKLLSAATLAVSPFYIVYFIFYDRSIRQTGNYWLDILVIVMILCAVLIMLRCTAAAVAVTTVICAVFEVLNEILLVCRKAAITPADIFSFGTAMEVSGQYKFVFTYRMVIAVLAMAAAILVSVRVNTWFVVKNRRFSLILNLLLTVFPIAVIAYGVEYISKTTIKDIDTFDISASNRKAGTATTFANGIKNMIVKPPVNYSNRKAKEILAEFQPQEESGFQYPDVVVIMNESFSDLAAFCGIGETSEWLPEISAIKENMIKGYAQVSIFGGNTANTEFEFLTGNSLHFLPSGYIPYMRTITKATPTIVNDFYKLGYKTVAVHPYMPQCWRRSSVYPFFGFDEFISGTDFDEDHDESNSNRMRGSIDFGDLKYIRKYVSDEENYDMVLKKLEEAPSENKFIFNVTMQNHGPYTYDGDDFEPYLEKYDIHEDVYSNPEETEQYLTLIRESDKAFADFIAEIKKREKPTVVLMFGDHLPGLKAVNESIKHKTPAEKQAKYTVPYFIIANYDIGYEERTEMVGMSYLSNDLKKLINMPLTSWDMLRESAREEYPSMNAYGAFDKDGEWHTVSENEEYIEPEIIKKYRTVQYGHLYNGIS